MPVDDIDPMLVNAPPAIQGPKRARLASFDRLASIKDLPFEVQYPLGPPCLSPVCTAERQSSATGLCCTLVPRLNMMCARFAATLCSAVKPPRELMRETRMAAPVTHKTDQPSTEVAEAHTVRFFSSPSITSIWAISGTSGKMNFGLGEREIRCPLFDLWASVLLVSSLALRQPTVRRACLPKGMQ